MPSDSSQTASWPQLLAMGAAAAAIVALGMVAGWLIDSAADSAPTFLMIGLGVGIVAAAASMIVQFRKFLRSTDPKSQP